MPNIKINLSVVCASIMRGDYTNEELDKIIKTIRVLREIEASERGYTLAPGDRVRITEIRPRYLNGLVVTVNKVNRKTVVTDFPLSPEFQRYAGARNVRIPLASVEKV